MKVTEFGVSVTRKVDLGFAPYMELLESLHGRSPAFGTRENTTFEMTHWGKAQLEEGEELQVKAAELTYIILETIDKQMDAEGIEKADEMATFNKVEIVEGSASW